MAVRLARSPLATARSLARAAWLLESCRSASRCSCTTWSSDFTTFSRYRLATLASTGSDTGRTDSRCSFGSRHERGDGMATQFVVGVRRVRAPRRPGSHRGRRPAPGGRPPVTCAAAIRTWRSAAPRWASARAARGGRQLLGEHRVVDAREDRLVDRDVAAVVVARVHQERCPRIVLQRQRNRGGRELGRDRRGASRPEPSSWSPGTVVVVSSGTVVVVSSGTVVVVSAWDRRLRGRRRDGLTVIRLRARHRDTERHRCDQRYRCESYLHFSPLPQTRRHCAPRDPLGLGSRRVSPRRPWVS